MRYSILFVLMLVGCSQSLQDLRATRDELMLQIEAETVVIEAYYEIREPENAKKHEARLEKLNEKLDAVNEKLRKKF